MAAKKTQQRSKTNTILVGVASIILGIVLFMDPTGAAIFAVTLAGIILIVLGVVTLINYIRAGNAGSQVDFFVSLVEIIFGAVLLFWPDYFVNWLVFILGIFIIVTGVGDFSDARIASRLGSPHATVKLVLAIITIVLGVLVTFSPFTFVDVAFTIAGVGLVINGITELVAAFQD